MRRNRSKSATARVWFWSRVEFVRFTTAVERLVAAVADLAVILEREKRRRSKAAQPGTSAAAAATAIDPHMTVPPPEEGGPPW